MVRNVKDVHNVQYMMSSIISENEVDLFLAGGPNNQSGEILYKRRPIWSVVLSTQEIERRSDSDILFYFQ